MWANESIRDKWRGKGEIKVKLILYPWGSPGYIQQAMKNNRKEAKKVNLREIL